MTDNDRAAGQRVRSDPDVDPTKDKFSARLWLWPWPWTVYPDRSVDPLPKLSCSNADAPTRRIRT